MEKEIIRVNVPGTTGFYRFLVSAFYEADKTTFNRMLKAVSADPETLQENVSAILEFPRKESFPFYQERIKAISALLEKKENKKQSSAAEKAISKYEKICQKENKYREVFQKPFYINGIKYLTDTKTALRFDSEDCSDISNTEKVSASFENVFSTCNSSITLPSFDQVKAFNTGKKAFSAKNWDRDTKGFSLVYLENGSVIDCYYLHIAMEITGAKNAYVTEGNSDSIVRLTGNGYSFIIMPFKSNNVSLPKNDKNTIAHCIYAYDYNSYTTSPKIIGSVPFESVSVSELKKETETDPEIENSSVSVQETISGNEKQEQEKETVSVNPAEIKADSHGYSMESFRQVYSRFYNHLYNTGEYHRELVYRFDHELTVFEIEILKAYIEYRKDCISSDREAAAFCMAVDHIQYVEKEDVSGIDPESVSAIENNSSVDPAGKEFTNDVTVHNEEETITETIPDCSAVHVLPHRNAGSRNSSAYWNPSACSANARNMPVLHSSRHETITMQGNTSRSVNERIRPPT